MSNGHGKKPEDFKKQMEENFRAKLSEYSHVKKVIGIVSGKGGQGCAAAVGYSVLNKTSKVNVGSLMLRYNGGGHEKVGTCQFTDESMKTDLPKMLDELIELANL